MMETREIVQVRVYLLILNSIYDRAESGDICAISTDYDALVLWYYEQLADEPYRDGRYYKVFRPDSYLVAYNRVDSLELNDLNPWGQGICDKWISYDEYENIRATGRFLIVGG